MRIDDKGSPRRTGAKPLAQQRGDERNVSFNELKRQLGLNLIEAARDQAGSDANAPCFRNRR